MKPRFISLVATVELVLLTCLPRLAYANEGQKILGGSGKVSSALVWLLVGIGVLWVAVQVMKNMDQNGEQ